MRCAPSAGQHSPAGLCCLDLHGPPVALVPPPAHQALALEAVDDARHRGGAHAFGCGQLAQCERPSEDDHGQRRESRRADPAGRVGIPCPTEHVDRGGVELVGDRLHIVAHSDR